MTFQLIARLSAWTLVCFSASSAMAQSAAPANAKWVTFADCPVILENRYIVSARETGVVESVAVESNEAVKNNQLLLSLENFDAQTKLDSAIESHAIAVQLAADDSALQLRKLDLQFAEINLTQHSDIPNSVSAIEIRKMRAEVEAARVKIIDAEYSLKRMKMQADFAKRAVETAKKNLAYRDIRAPSDGIVHDLMVRRGQAVEAGKPVMEIWDLRQLQVVCLIPFEKIDLTRLNGLEVRVESNHRSATGVPIRLAGKITSYDPKLNSMGELRVLARIQNLQQDGHWLLLPDMKVRLEVAVPAQAAGEVPALISRRP